MLIIPDLYQPPVSDDKFHVKFQIDESCKKLLTKDILKRLENLTDSGLFISLSEIVVSARVFFSGSPDDNLSPEELNELCNHIIWGILRFTKPEVKTNKKNIPKLQLTGSNESRLQAFISEILAIGIGLVAASYIYDIPFFSWKSLPKLQRMDFDAISLNGFSVRLEVKGRSDRRNLSSAKSETKFKIKKDKEDKNISQPDYYAGLTFLLENNINSNGTQLYFTDPPGVRTTNADFLIQNFRNILKHFASFFTEQGFIDFANRLITISDSSIDKFYFYLENGDTDLLKLLPHKSYRTTYKIKNSQNGESFAFKGTAFEGWKWPSYQTIISLEKIHKGYFFWGLWSPIFNCLVDGELDKIRTMQIKSQTMYLDPYIYILLPNGFILIWSPTIDELIAHQ